MTIEPTINPYAPPAADTETAQQAPTGHAFPHPMFSPMQIAAASLLGSVLAGTILLQSNYRAMARPGDANRALLYGILATVAAFALRTVLPDSIPMVSIPIGLALGFYWLADHLQGPAFVSHRAGGGERQSNWLVFGISVGTLVSILVIVFLIVRASAGLDD